MLSDLGWVLFASIVGMVVALLLCGCSPDTATKKKQQVEVQLTLVLHAADVIDAKMEEARTHNDAATVIVAAAATRPSTPPQTRLELATATGEMHKTGEAINAVPAQTRAVRGGAEDQANTAKKSIDGEEKAATDLAKERDHWFGYKSRVAFWVLVALLPVIGLVVFCVKVAGGGPLLEVLSELVAGFFRLLGRWIRVILTPIYHLVTLGMAKLADRVNQKWSMKDTGMKIQSKPTAGVPTIADNNATAHHQV